MKSFKEGDILTPISNESWGIDLKDVKKVKFLNWYYKQSGQMNCELLDDIDVYDTDDTSYISKGQTMMVYAEDFKLLEPKIDTYEIF